MGRVKWQIVDLPLGIGLDTRSDERLLPQTKLEDLQNAVFDTLGAIKKRFGYRALSRREFDPLTEELVSSGSSVFTRGTELLAIQGQRLRSYLDGSQSWADRGTVLDWTSQERTVAGAGELDNSSGGRVSVTPNTSNYSCARGAEYRVCAWIDADTSNLVTIRFSVLENATGAVVAARQNLITAGAGAFSTAVVVTNRFGTPEETITILVVVDDVLTASTIQTGTRLALEATATNPTIRFRGGGDDLFPGPRGFHAASIEGSKILWAGATVASVTPTEDLIVGVYDVDTLTFSDETTHAGLNRTTDIVDATGAGFDTSPVAVIPGPAGNTLVLYGATDGIRYVGRRSSGDSSSFESGLAFDGFALQLTALWSEDGTSFTLLYETGSTLLSSDNQLREVRRVVVPYDGATPTVDLPLVARAQLASHPVRFQGQELFHVCYFGPGADALESVQRTLFLYNLDGELLGQHLIANCPIRNFGRPILASPSIILE